MRKILPFLLCLLLSACSTPKLYEKSSEPEQATSEVTRPEAREAVSRQQQARVAMTLAQEAERLDKAGQHQKAIAKLERALAIDGESAQLWQRLAVVRFNQKDWVVAEGLAKKSLEYSELEPEITRVNWLIIAESRRFLGDKAGAAAAMARSKIAP